MIPCEWTSSSGLNKPYPLELFRFIIHQTPNMNLLSMLGRMDHQQPGICAVVFEKRWISNQCSVGWTTNYLVYVWLCLNFHLFIDAFGWKHLLTYLLFFVYHALPVNHYYWCLLSSMPSCAGHQAIRKQYSWISFCFLNTYVRIQEMGNFSNLTAPSTSTPNNSTIQEVGSPSIYKYSY